MKIGNCSRTRHPFLTTKHTEEFTENTKFWATTVPISTPFEGEWLSLCERQGGCAGCGDFQIAVKFTMRIGIRITQTFQTKVAYSYLHFPSFKARHPDEYRDLHENGKVVSRINDFCGERDSGKWLLTNVENLRKYGIV